jgi:hypothetical protein
MTEKEIKKMDKQYNKYVLQKKKQQQLKDEYDEFINITEKDIKALGFTIGIFMF